ncbi:O-methyltransferase-domain-containing protein [Mucor mucedo]|uniref:O-methyltransferase-domain-containing protein n=1 Tax=Mucor mucedo TaxID=29922 RepID=UPI0022209AA8|nr:O-methyltransferase-domain-containing protein [Mucor mucedo]KAI7870106.1 O-methyltransferase-domain-containing protein [Mucor mucedo]
MNRLIARSIFLSTKYVKPVPSYAFKHRYATFDVNDKVGNPNGRLRVEESHYCDNISSPFKEPYGNILKALNKETEEKFDNPHMMVCPVQAKFLYQLVGILKPKNVLEIGGFTGYSAIAMGAALSPGSKLLSLELEPKHIVVANRFIEEANLQDKVSVKEGPAGDSITEIANESPKKQFDLIFLDADKGGYIDYYEMILSHNLLSDHGVIVADNVLFYGEVHKVVDGYDGYDGESHASKNVKRTAKKVDNFNQHVFKDSRVEVVVLPAFDGLSFIRKRLT